MEKITISSKIDSKFEFEMSAIGVDLKLGKALFETEISKGIKYSVNCINESGKLWSVTIPKGLIPNGSYAFTLCVIADEYYFEPVKGKLEVVSSEIIEVLGVPANKQQPKEKDTSTKKPTAKKVTAKKPKINEDNNISDELIESPHVEEKHEPTTQKPKFDLFKSKEYIEEMESERNKEVKYSNRKFDTIYPIDNMPKSVLTKKGVKAEELKSSLQDNNVDVIIENEQPKIITETPVETPVETQESVTESELSNVPAKRKRFFADIITTSVQETPDANTRVKKIINDSKQPKTEKTPVPESTKAESNFMEEVEYMKAVNRKREMNKKVRNLIKSTTKK